jgi:hypothetical protein
MAAALPGFGRLMNRIRLIAFGFSFFYFRQEAEYDERLLQAQHPLWQSKNEPASPLCKIDTTDPTAQSTCYGFPIAARRH